MTDLQTMETSLYDDHCYSSAMSGESSQNSPAESSGGLKRPAAIALGSNSDSRNIKELKKNLTLDFTSPESAKKTLATPDIVRFLQLASPELEKFLTQGVVQVTTPTPTNFLFPKNVTADQEQYARGFIDALNHLHQLNNFSPGANLLSPGFAASLVGTSIAANSKASTSTSTAQQDSPVTSSAANSVQKVPVQSPTNPGTSVASVIMGTVGFPPGTVVNMSNYPVLQPAIPGGSMTIRDAMALMSAQLPAATGKEPNQPAQLLTEERPPSQSAEARTMEFHNLTQAQPTASSSVPPVATSAKTSSFQQILSHQPAQYLDVSTTSSSNQISPRRSGQIIHIKSEPDQAVPNINLRLDGSFGMAASGSRSTAPDSGGSLNMEVQEAMKLERKRARNRIAATKCRKRKLERIADLDREVRDQQDHKKLLAEEAVELEEEIKRLRANLEDHESSGCVIRDSAPSATTTRNVNGVIAALRK